MSIVSDWLSPTGIATFVLAAGVLVAAYQIRRERLDRESDRERMLDERPHFTLRDIPSIHPQSIIFTQGKPPNAVGTINIGLLKFKIANEGATSAKEARAFFHYSDTDDALPSAWTSMTDSNSAHYVHIPDSSRFDPESVPNLLRFNYFREELGQGIKRDVPPDVRTAAICLFTIEGERLAYHTNFSIPPIPLPAELGINMAVVMENAPQSVVKIPFRIRLLSWDKLDVIPL